MPTTSSAIVSETYSLESMCISVPSDTPSIEDLGYRLADLSLSLPTDILPSSDSDSDGESVYVLRNRRVTSSGSRPVQSQPAKSGSVFCSGTNKHGKRCGNKTLQGRVACTARRKRGFGQCVSVTPVSCTSY